MISVAGGAAKYAVTFAANALASSTPFTTAFSDNSEPSVGIRMFLYMAPVSSFGVRQDPDDHRQDVADERADEAERQAPRQELAQRDLAILLLFRDAQRHIERGRAC